MPISPPLLLDSKNDSSLYSEIALHLDKRGPVLLPGARLQRDARAGDRTTAARPLSMCPSGTGAADSGSTLRITRRYSAIHLDGSTSESVLRGYSAPVQSPEPIPPAIPGPVKPLKSEYITKRYGMAFGPTKRVFEPPPRVRPDASHEYWGSYDQEAGQISPYADNVSEDGASTVYDSFDFPQPPPIASPLIRRMQSNFWFQDDNGYSQRLSQKQRAALGMEPTYPQTPRASCSTGVVADNEANLRHQSQLSTSTISGQFPTDYLVRNPYSDATNERENLARIGDMLFGENANNWPDSITASRSDDPRRPFGFHTSLAQHGPPNITLSQSTPIMSSYHSTNAASHQVASDRQKMGRLPRIIRKVASMRSDTQKVEQVAEHVEPPPVPVGHRAIPKARSFRSIFRSSEADESRSRIPVFGNASNRVSWLDTNLSLQSAADPRVSSSTHLEQYNFPPGGQGKAHFQHQGCYIPLGGDKQHLREKRLSVNYAEPAPQQSTFHHHHAAGVSAQRYPDVGSTSFIDLSSGNRGSRSEGKTGRKRERMKGFFAKTGSGLFGWGNQKKNKNDGQ